MAEQKQKFVNPFKKGISYKDFLESVPKGSTVESHCKDHLTKAELSWLITELKCYEANNKALDEAKKQSEAKTESKEE